MNRNLCSVIYLYRNIQLNHTMLDSLHRRLLITGMVCLLGCIVLSGAVSAQEAVATDEPEIRTSPITGYDYIGNSSYLESEDTNVLTQAGTNQAGIVWLDKETPNRFTTEFEYKAGGGTGADGLVYMFNKKRGYSPSSGGRLAFITKDRSLVPGYGIEFDSHENSADPSDSHIALIYGDTTNHLAEVDSSKIEDNEWHQARVKATEDRVRVWVDDEPVLNWTGYINRTEKNMGFGAATGARTNNHRVKNISVTDSSSGKEDSESEESSRYTNEEGYVDSEGLLDAGADYRNGEIDEDRLSEVASAFRSGEPLS